MKYKIQQIGAVFSNEAIQQLEKKFSAEADAGYRFHSVFSVEKSGCLANQTTTTYLAVFEKNE